MLWSESAFPVIKVLLGDHELKWLAWLLRCVWNPKLVAHKVNLAGTRYLTTSARIASRLFLVYRCPMNRTWSFRWRQCAHEKNLKAKNQLQNKESGNIICGKLKMVLPKLFWNSLLISPTASLLVNHLHAYFICWADTKDQKISRSIFFKDKECNNWYLCQISNHILYIEIEKLKIIAKRSLCFTDEST